MSSRATTLKAHGRLLFDLQWFGSVEQRIEGDPVVTSSPWYSWRSSWRFWYMSFMIDVPIDSGDFDSGDDGDATAVEPSLFGRCIFDDVSRIFTFDAIMIDLKFSQFSLILFCFKFTFKFCLLIHKFSFELYFYDTFCFFFPSCFQKNKLPKITNTRRRRFFYL